MIKDTDKITKLDDYTSWMFYALRKQTVKAIKAYRTDYGVELKAAKDYVRDWQDWVFAVNPHWEWMIHAIGPDSDVQTATELFMKIKPNSEQGIKWHRDQVQSFQKAWETDGAVGWGVGAMNHTPQVDGGDDGKITGSLGDLRAALQKGG